MQFDDKKPEDVMKMDADENGYGGDDAYDSLRYLLMSRATPGKLPDPPSPRKNTFSELKQWVEDQETIRRATYE
jgi:hypothetical protein